MATIQANLPPVMGENLVDDENPETKTLILDNPQAVKDSSSDHQDPERKASFVQQDPVLASPNGQLNEPVQGQ